MDFLRNRMLRQTLLCHHNLTPRYGLRWEDLRQFHLGSRATPADAPLDIRSGAVSKFKSADGAVPIWLNDFEQALVRRLDGALGRAELSTAIVGDCVAGQLHVEKDGIPTEDPDTLHGVLGEAIDRQLAVLARKALLVK
jgi:methyltransferase-like protein